MKKLYPILLALITLLLIIVVTSCSTTTYLNLTQESTSYINSKLYKVKTEEDLGVEVSLSLKDGNEVSGELLSVRDSSLTLCSEYSANEDDLKKHIYPISIISSNDIQQLTFVGSSWIWEGIAAGAFVGGLSGMFIASEGLEVMAGLVIGTWIGVTVGWIAGYALSTEEYVVQDIPPNYNWFIFNSFILKPLTRYPSGEPEYLRAIK
jgi:hypothetical protein